MRRSDREVTSFDEMVQIMERCQVCRLAFNHDGYPYLLPVNFGMDVTDQQITLYFHSALEGTKHAVIRADPRASFEMDCDTVLCSRRDTGMCSMSYSSVIGRGVVERVTDEAERVHALDRLTAHYHPEGFAYDPASIPATAVYRLRVTQLTAKHRPAKK